jgi:hypothetical protein
VALQGVGCNCAAPASQSDILAKCATCECSSYGCCRPPDCSDPLCGSCTNCSSCTTGPDSHRCVTTPVLRQCYFAQGTTVLNPFQVVVKMSVLFFDSSAYSWVSFAANSQRSSLQFLLSDGSSVFAGQPSLSSPPGFSTPPQRMFYATSVFGPLDWTVLAPRFNSNSGVQIRICDAGACTVSNCLFGADKPVLKPSDVGL